MEKTIPITEALHITSKRLSSNINFPNMRMTTKTIIWQPIAQPKFEHGGDSIICVQKNAPSEKMNVMVVSFTLKMANSSQVFPLKFGFECLIFDILNL